MAFPKPVPTVVHDESFAGVTYHITGELVPVLTIDLKGTSVFFEHHILLWKDTAVNIGVKVVKGAFKRMIAGMQVFMTEASGTGHIAFSRDGAGQVLPIHLAPGQAIDVREHQFLAATENVGYTFTRVKGISNILLGGTGFFIDTFTAENSEGILWLHGYGNVFEVVLGAGESIDVEPGGWVYKDPSVTMDTGGQRLSMGLLAGSGNIFWNRFTGPGRVGIQSMYVHITEEK